MKTRAGFVSNSSSSSFCMVGFSVDVEDPADFEILQKIGKIGEDVEFGDDDIELWVSYGVEDLNSGFMVMGSDAPSMVGLAAEGYLNDDWTISQIKAELIKKLAELGITKTAEEMYFEFGEAGGG